MADTPRKRWVRVTLSVVDAPEGKMPSGSYDETKLAEESFSVPVSSELELIVGSDEVSGQVRSIVGRVNKHAPQLQPEPEPEAPVAQAPTPRPVASSSPERTTSSDVADIPF